MNLNTIKGRIRLITLGFLLLAFTSFAVSVALISTQRTDATIINLAGRQRMLTQQLTWMALNNPDHPGLQSSIEHFLLTMSRLKSYETGERVPVPEYIAREPDVGLSRELEKISEQWADFHRHLLKVRETDPLDPAFHQSATKLQLQSIEILTTLDSLVDKLEEHAQRKTTRLFWAQVIFIGVALALAMWTARFSKSQITKPLEDLVQTVQRMESGNLDSTEPTYSYEEIQHLAGAFESLRTEILNSRQLLEQSIWQRTREITTAFEFSQEIIARHDLAELCQSVVDRTCELTGSDSVSLCLFDSPGNSPMHTARRFPIACSATCGETQSSQPGQCLSRENQMYARPTGEIPCDYLQSLASGQCLITPLKIGEQNLGAFCLLRNEGPPYDVDQQRAVSLLANSAAIAIHNARLATARQAAAEREAILMERDRLAAELHDHLAQTLSYLRLKAEQADSALAGGSLGNVSLELGLIRKAADTAYAQVRDALADLLPRPSDPGLLFEELHRCVGQFSGQSGLKIELELPDPTEPALPAHIQHQAVQIVAEALRNAQRHAQAQNVKVSVNRSAERVVFQVSDDGNGFNPMENFGPNHLGLKFMRARAERSHGNLSILSAPHEGTRVVAEFSLTR